ncbi:2-dehydro-3-deoxygalactonokinase [Pseudoxanthomonas sp.]|uniref:2-dehydro-3-deoxygalactonokinase n=1 Tax=Pseudoxanthomonas sp. TaxID=1871049 RepID=UPI00258CC95E|nr:2-dehydro-3-deoxygalactonokinase [Pseudoxanthomonas sp.]MCR6685197.1 2-dehydro-3-deoxygalactonokinase [Pseudoxanthomonas sp.]
MIAVDWGTSSLRAYRVDADGAILEQRRGSDGALASAGRFGQVLAALLEGWDDPLVVLGGMVGGRGGWVEVPYVDCPAGLDALAAGMLRLDDDLIDAPALRGRALWCAAGMCDRQQAAADVMRGEETQVAALFDLLGPGEHRICLPGTHSKWVQVRDGRIVRIATAMTGEVYGLLRRHSILARSMPEAEPALDPAAFDAGAADPGPAGLLHELFGVRTAALFGRFDGDALPSYLSGLLVGHELRAALPADAAGTVHLLGADTLLERYARALEAMGMQVRRHREDLAATGLHRLAQARGLA